MVGLWAARLQSRAALFLRACAALLRNLVEHEDEARHREDYGYRHKERVTCCLSLFVRDFRGLSYEFLDVVRDFPGLLYEFLEARPQPIPQFRQFLGANEDEGKRQDEDYLTATQIEYACETHKARPYCTESKIVLQPCLSIENLPARFPPGHS